MSDNKVAITRKGFLKKRVMTAFKHAPKFDGSKFEKKFEDEDNTKAITSFLDEKSVRCLLFSGASGDTIVASTDLGSVVTKGKCVAFVKTVETELSDKNIRDCVVTSEVTGQPISQLQELVKSVYLPTLSNPRNQDGLGDVVSKEIMDRFHNFMDSVSITDRKSVV